MSTGTQEKRSPPQTPITPIKIVHTQDLIAAIAMGQVTPNGPLPDSLNRPSVRAFIKAIHYNPHKPVDQPYSFHLSDDTLVRFALMNGAYDTFAPPIHQLPGPDKIPRWVKAGKLHLAPCKRCGMPTAVIEVFVGTKPGYFSIEDGVVRLDFLTEDDFKPRRAWLR